MGVPWTQPIYVRELLFACDWPAACHGTIRHGHGFWNSLKISTGRRRRLAATRQERQCRLQIPAIENRPIGGPEQLVGSRFVNELSSLQRAMAAAVQRVRGPGKPCSRTGPRGPVRIASKPASCARHAAFSVPTLWRTADPDLSPADRGRDPAPARRVAAGIEPNEWCSEEATAMEEGEATMRKEAAVPRRAAPGGAVPCPCPKPHTAAMPAATAATMPAAATPPACLRRSRDRCRTD